MSNKLSLFLHGEMLAVAESLNTDPAPMDTLDTQAVITNICRRVDNLERFRERLVEVMEELHPDIEI